MCFPAEAFGDGDSIIFLNDRDRVIERGHVVFRNNRLLYRYGAEEKPVNTRYGLIKSLVHILVNQFSHFAIKSFDLKLCQTMHEGNCPVFDRISLSASEKKAALGHVFKPSGYFFNRTSQTPGN